MGLKLNTSIALARGILNDPSAVRYSAADLLVYANDSLDQLAALAPQLFYVDAVHICATGKAEQELTFNTALAMVNVNRITSGKVVRQMDIATLDAYDPDWRSATAAAAVHWAPYNGHPLKFLVYPKAPAAQSLDITYVAVPGEYTDTADTGLPTALSDAVADYVVARAESRNDESVLTERAQMFMQSFVNKVKGA